uniref:CRIB domain-containing protein n=1 Tax=Electrophorus electricus TaxID=8005 RepID=A0AAY5EG64_ELEEL
MAAKAPIYLKRRSRKGKKEKLRDLLSSDMISPPLGDFRHTIHIGGGGADDLFGDLSFLQGKFHLLPGQRDHQGACELSRAASVSGTPPVSDGSPLLKNALSLPVIGGVQALTLPAAGGAPSPQQPPRSPPLPLGPGPDARHMAGQGEEEEEEERPYLSHAGSLLSLHLDLGPSILDDVLQIMDGLLGPVEVPTSTHVHQLGF